MDSKVHIVDYDDSHAAAFRALNLEWLDAYQLTESHDLQVLDDPRGTIIDRGGRIFIACSENAIAGTAAIMNEGHGVFELAKMTVAPAFRGRGISKLLLEHCLNNARALNAEKIQLFSNHRLEAALQLYRQFGFRDVPVENSPFETADVKMELRLSKLDSAGRVS